MYVIADRAEQAFAALVTPAVAALNPKPQVTTGKASADKVLPFVICSAGSNGGEEDPYTSGNYWLDVSVEIKSTAVQNQSATNPADNPLSTNETILDAVCENLYVTNLNQLLSAAVTDFTCIAIIPESPGREYNVEGSIWVDTLHFRVYCCASALSS